MIYTYFSFDMKAALVLDTIAHLPKRKSWASTTAQHKILVRETRFATEEVSSVTFPRQTGTEAKSSAALLTKKK